jgi:hypothetical protein
MARMKPKARTEIGLFNVLYEDGTLTSNRKVRLDVPFGTDDADYIQAEIEAQDQTIAEKSGKFRAPIKSIEKVKQT